MSSLKRYLLTLNIFEKNNSNENEQQDDQREKSNIIATRVFIIVLILSLCETGFLLFITKQETLITIEYPTIQQFENLPSNTHCSCSHISIPYGKFTSIQTIFHQVCSSDFITDRWFNAIHSQTNTITFFIKNNFRNYGSTHFQALAGFCRLSKANIEQSLDVFYQSTLLSPEIVSRNVLHSQTLSIITQFRLTAPNTFKTQLRLINEMTMNNQLVSGLQTNFNLVSYIFPDIVQMTIRAVTYTSVDGSFCRCNVDVCTKFATSFIYSSWSTDFWYIPGISASCLPVISILISTLECFYNQTSVDKLLSYFTISNNETRIFTAMIYNEQSHFDQNATIQTMIDNLMIEDWLENISYEKYYSECTPSSCTYMNTSHHSSVYILTKLIGILSSLILTLRLIIPSLTRFIQRLRSPIPRPHVSICTRLHHLKGLIREKLIELNLFEHYPSTDQQICYQRYATRLYMFLIFNSIGLLTVSNLYKTTLQSKTIFQPTEFQYQQLQQDYSYTLSCLCNSISMSYSTFLTIQPNYHQLCSSDLISEQWILYLRQSRSCTPFCKFAEYRINAPIHFQLLAMFCQQAHQTINDAPQLFLQTQFVNSQVVPQQTFDIQWNSVIQDWISTTVNTFKRTIQLVRSTNQGNRLINVDNILPVIDVISRTIKLTSSYFSDCNCAISALCRVPMGILEYDQYSYRFVETYSMPNFYVGCFLIEALFASSLECFYNLTCMLEIDQYVFSAQPFNFSALDLHLNSPKDIIETIANNMMVDTWSSNVSYSSYYDQCAPSSCTFPYEQHASFISIFTMIVGVFGGLSVGLKLIFMVGLQFIDKILMNNFSYLTLINVIKHIFTCHNEYQMIHRIHFILVIAILNILYIFSAFDPQVITVKIDEPSLLTYKNLVAQSYDSLQCSCSQISIKYKSVLNITSRFHQVCSSDFVSDQWISYIYGTIHPLCPHDFVNTQLLSPQELIDHIQTKFDDFQFTMPKLFVNILSLIRETTGANMLFSGLSTNWIISISSNITNELILPTIPLTYNACNCKLSAKCVSPSRRMPTGCYPLEALLQSSLECLYDEQCIDLNNMFKAMNSSSLPTSRFPMNTSIETIVNQLMVEEFQNNTSYQLYFDQCAPLSCTYSYIDKNNILEGITTLISLYGGLVIICRLFAIIIVKNLLCLTQRVNPIND
ncbi:hypothetical protein I4U23_004010 [Adineta vaga]|nr:hypothetical protein I4U23_004010 [Adineta vaga]